MTTSRWWAERYPYPDAHAIDIRNGGTGWESRDGTPVTTSFAVPDRRWLPTSWRVELHPTMLQELVVLHELAHCVSPRHDGDIAGIRQGKVLSRPHANHGPMFTATLTALVREFGSGTDRSELAHAYAHFEVAMATDSELRAAIDRGLQVEEILTEWYSELETPSATGSEAIPAVQRPPAQIPNWTWGDELRLIRSRPRPEVSQSAIAATVSAIEPCTRRHIARLENATDLPDDLRLRRIAMALVAFRGIDPVYARHHLGLVRWDGGTALDELRLVNPDWVALVEHLNALGDARPPFWTVPGDR